MSLTHYLSEVKERAEKATKGPWKWDIFGLRGKRNYDTRIKWFGGTKTTDKEFIAHSRTDVERLVRICEAQAEALRIIRSGTLDEVPPYRYAPPANLRDIASEALSTADLIAKGDK